MILYGRDLSPFTRRVAIWCALQGRPVIRRPLMVSGEDFDALKRINPLGRVPILQLDDGATLIETFAIIDWLEDTAEPGARLLPETGLPRRKAMQEIAYANSVAEKAVALVYEHNRRPEQYRWPEWCARLEGQIRGGLEAMEAHAPEEEGWLGGATPYGGDVAFVCAYDFIAATNPRLLEGPSYPRLAWLSERANRMPAFGDSRPEPA
ncbi:glutathione S-transferase family protein [Oceanicella actignis]|uniref:glutathione S-transferase family protein n=1 Tax=Oceanicella actignis TaxID=1189325 RepID=UPI0011E635C8|nr:glutathione S-transferase family protein [Oceanicella actignis]TYO85421.1 glutathione S-transferase [Oceanicella actignis]